MASPDHQVGALFEALDEGVLMAPSKSIGYLFAISSCPEVRCFGHARNTFKERYQGHKQSFENPTYRGSTTLSAKVWDLKEKGFQPEIKWNILHTTRPYKAGMKSCDLCLLEKTRILLGRDGPEALPLSTILLNRRTEVTSKCRHRLKFTLEEDYLRRHGLKKQSLRPP